MKVPDSSVPIRAWHVWTVNEDSILTSGSASVIWTPNEPARFSCDLPAPHAAPALDHDCGIAGVPNSEWAYAWARTIRTGRPLILGTAELWGHVIEHRHGWRAAYAYPVAFAGVISKGRLGRKISRSILWELADLYKPLVSKNAAPLRR